MMLTQDFSLMEMLKSDTADDINFIEQYNPKQEVVNNLRQLCECVLQPARWHTGPIQVTSGYRHPIINKLIGGAYNSQHVEGKAADVILNTKEETFGFGVVVLRLGLPFDQLIFEFGEHITEPEWVHISWSESQRGDILRKERGKPYQKMTKDQIFDLDEYP